jgi:hypothetical protein
MAMKIITILRDKTAVWNMTFAELFQQGTNFANDVPDMSIDMILEFIYQIMIKEDPTKDMRKALTSFVAWYLIRYLPTQDEKAYQKLQDNIAVELNIIAGDQYFDTHIVIHDEIDLALRESKNATIH